MTCYTYTRRPLKLVYVASFQYIHDAIAWEKKVKRWNRKKKEALIRGDFDALITLSKRTPKRKEPHSSSEHPSRLPDLA